MKIFRFSLPNTFVALLISFSLLPLAGQNPVFAQMKNMPGKMKMSAPMKSMPNNLDFARAKNSEQAKFHVSVASKLDPITKNKMHSWVVQVKDTDGKPVTGAKINISGGMPMHGHGLPTTPQVTKNLGGGKYLVEGVRFNMGGWWQMKLAIDSGTQKDKVAFNLMLK